MKYITAIFLTLSAVASIAAQNRSSVPDNLIREIDKNPLKDYLRLGRGEFISNNHLHPKASKTAISIK